MAAPPSRKRKAEDEVEGRTAAKRARIIAETEVLDKAIMDVYLDEFYRGLASAIPAAFTRVGESWEIALAELLVHLVRTAQIAHASFNAGHTDVEEYFLSKSTDEARIASFYEPGRGQCIRFTGTPSALPPVETDEADPGFSFAALAKGMGVDEFWTNMRTGDMGQYFKVLMGTGFLGSLLDPAKRAALGPINRLIVAQDALRELPQDDGLKWRALVLPDKPEPIPEYVEMALLYRCTPEAPAQWIHFFADHPTKFDLGPLFRVE